MKIEKVTLVCITLGDVYSISGSYEHFLSASLTLCELCIYILFTFSVSLPLLWISYASSGSGLITLR